MGTRDSRICYVLGVKLLPGLAGLSALCLLCSGAERAEQNAGWTEAGDSHFSVYSQLEASDARALLVWFEELRRFFEQNGIAETKIRFTDRPAVRVIVFRSANEYNAFRVRKTADAYYVGTQSQDYIVLPGLGTREFALAAHEYTHLVLHASKLRLPLWLSEGFAEVFSSIQIREHHSEVGRDLPMRAETLRRIAWLPLSRLVCLDARSPLLATRDGMAIFYAQSWALAKLLILSDQYAPKFRQFVEALSKDETTSDAIAKIYGKSLDEVMKDLQAFTTENIARGRVLTISLSPATLPMQERVETRLSQAQADELLADLLLANGELDRAEALYRELGRQKSANPRVHGALGTIALKKGDRKTAEHEWQMAVDNGIADANLCYEYASVAADEGADLLKVRRILERALVLKPDFDDARYRLALIESNAGEYEASFQNLHAMGKPSHERAFNYWSTIAYVLTELNRGAEADNAAHEALKCASTDSDRVRAQQLAYIAETDLSVRFARDQNGNLRLVTTRVPHGSAEINPFIESDDLVRSAEGVLREVQCGEGKLTGLLIDTENGLLTLTVPDPQHVLLRSGPSEFTCGPQTPRKIKVEYAAAKAKLKGDGVLKGMALQ